MHPHETATFHNSTWLHHFEEVIDTELLSPKLRPMWKKAVFYDRLDNKHCDAEEQTSQAQRDAWWKESKRITDHLSKWLHYIHAYQPRTSEDIAVKAIALWAEQRHMDTDQDFPTSATYAESMLLFAGKELKRAEPRKDAPAPQRIAPIF